MLPLLSLPTSCFPMLRSTGTHPSWSLTTVILARAKGFPQARNYWHMGPLDLWCGGLSCVPRHAYQCLWPPLLLIPVLTTKTISRRWRMTVTRTAAALGRLNWFLSLYCSIKKELWLTAQTWLLTAWVKPYLHPTKLIMPRGTCF